MRVALIDVDNIGKGSNAFPNLPLMKIAAYHKRRGDEVEIWQGLKTYDVAYKSKVFDFTPDIDFVIMADEVVEGGTGYGLENKLPEEIEHITPDYSIFNCTKAYGFLTRGCPRQCPFCIVGAKEGCKSVRAGKLGEFWTGQKDIVLLDPNLLACDEHEFLLAQLARAGARVDFTQGIDIRYTNRGNVAMLNEISVKQLHFAWDNPKQDLTRRFADFKRWTNIKDYRKLGVYVLTNYNSTHEEDLYRIYTLRDLGFWPYVMIYNKADAPKETRLLQRWVNNRRIFATIPDFKNYNSKIG